MNSKIEVQYLLIQEQDDLKVQNFNLKKQIEDNNI